MSAQPFVTQEIIDHVVDVIVQARHPDLVVLFGSCARGDYGWDSDLDLFLVMQTDLPPTERALEVRRLFDRLPCPMDIVVYTPTELAYWRDIPSSFVHQVLSQGVTLYERASKGIGATVGPPGGE